MKNKITLLIAILVLVMTSLVIAQPYNEWQEETELPAEQSGTRGSALVYAENKLFLIGGSAGATRHNETWSYDLETSTWTQKTNIPVTHTSYQQAGYHEGKIYATTNSEGNQGNDKFFAYDISTDTWNELASLPVAIIGNSMSIHDNKIYLYSVMMHGIRNNLTLIYDIDTDTWSYGAEAPRYKEGIMGGALIDEKIYDLAGEDYETYEFNEYLDIYDIANNTWTSEPLPHTELAIAYGGVTSLGKKVFAIGGVWDNNEWYYSNKTWIYNTETNEWTQKQDLPEERAEHGITKSEDTIWIAGGRNSEGIITNILRYQVISGCTDPEATNFNEDAIVDDGTCYYNPGCTDEEAVNYDSEADFDDGSCEYSSAATGGGGGGAGWPEDEIVEEIEEEDDVTDTGAPLFAIGGGEGEIDTTWLIVGIAAVVLIAGYFMMQNKPKQTRRKTK